MAWFDKVLYIRAIWYVIVGFIAICMGVVNLEKTPKNLNDLHKMEGYIVDTLRQNLTSIETGMTPSCFIIILNTNESAYIYYDLDKIKTANIKKGDYCTIWTRIEERIENQRNIIEVLTVNGNQVIDFKRAYWPFIIIGIGLVWFIIPLLFVVKRSDILFGKKKNEEDGENKKSIKEILKDCLQQLKIW